jgi:ABC-2 type transport system permease protein
MTARIHPAVTSRSGPSLGARLYGLGSVFGKTLRDSRRAILIAGLAAGSMMLIGAAPMAIQFTTVESRLEIVLQARSLPTVLVGLLGTPIAVETLGGFLSWRIGNFLVVFLALWSVVALSSTLSAEARRGSLDFVVASPVDRARIGVQKILAHVVAVVVALLVAAVITWMAGLVFATLPGDEIALAAALSQFGYYALLMLAAGSAAFAAAQFVGGTRATGLGLVVLFASFLIPAYSDLSPVIEALRPISLFALTEAHRPLAGGYDWMSLLPVAGITIGLFAIGLIGFVRRDLVEPTFLAGIRLPGLPAGTANPFVRQLAARLAVAIAWGIGVGLYGSVVAASADQFAAVIGENPQMQALIGAIYPDIDLADPAGVLQLVFFAFGSLMVGFAASTFLAGWSSDEGERRLDMVLGAPISRIGWALQSGLGVMAAVAVSAGIIGAVLGVVTIAQGYEPSGPIIGTAVLALYGMAYAGIGLAVGGLIRPSLAAPVAGALVIGSFLIELLGTALRLPDWIVSLSLVHHIGQPMAAIYDLFGMGLYAVLAVGGLILGAVGLSRRDIGR